jgi:hypothetical protein
MMQKIIYATKHLIIFLGLLAITVGFTVDIIFAFYRNFGSASWLQSYNLSEAEFKTLLYNNSVISFVLTYIMKYKILNLKTFGKFAKTCFLAVIYITVFIGLTVLVLGIL